MFHYYLNKKLHVKIFAAEYFTKKTNNICFITEFRKIFVFSVVLKVFLKRMNENYDKFEEYLVNKIYNDYRMLRK